MNTVTVYVPFSSAIIINAFTNASFTQKITLTPETGTAITYMGSGELNNPIGRTVLNTPASGSSPRGFQVQVTVQSWYNNQWVDSAVAQGSCGVMYYNMIMVVSEDYIDQDWNDAVTTFSWWVPPSTRSLSDYQLTAHTSDKKD